MFDRYIRACIFCLVFVAAVLTAPRLMAEEGEKRQSAEGRREQTLKAEQERRRAMQAKPLTKAEREKVLQDIKSGNTAKIKKALRFLVTKNVQPDEEVSKALEPLLKHGDSLVRYDAEKVMDKFTPNFIRGQELLREYLKSPLGNVKTLGPQVSKDTPLPEGLIVAVKDKIGFEYSAAMVMQVSGDKVMVVLRFMNRRKVVKRSDIRLAPLEMEQPFLKYKEDAGSKDGKPAGKEKSDGTKTSTFETTRRDTRLPTRAEKGYRSWSDDSGTYTIEARYVDSDGEKVTLLRKKDGRQVKVPLERLSEADREVARRLMAAPKAGNPFE